MISTNFKSRSVKALCALALGLLGMAPVQAEQVINVSGGGTGVLADAILGAQLLAMSTTDTIAIVITDSAVYNEPGSFNPIAVHNLSIRAEAGTSPEINFTATDDHSSSWAPSVFNFKLGDNAGGEITIRKRRGAGAIAYGISSMWLPDGATMVVENCTFTSAGPDGPWDGAAVFAAADTVKNVAVEMNNCRFIDFRDSTEPVILGPPWQSTVSMTLTDCTFEQSAPATQLVAIVGSASGRVMNLTLTRTVFRNVYRAVTVHSGSFNVNQTYVINPQEFGFVFDTTSNAKTSTISRSVFHGGPTAVRHILVASAGAATNVTIDHCDFYAEAEAVPAIEASDGTNATIVVSNTQISTEPALWSSTVGGSFNGTYRHCNIPGSSFGATISTDWVANGPVVTPAIAPDYADLPEDWRYSDATLLVADSGGGPIGSRLGWLAGGVDPVTSAAHWKLFD